MDQQNTTMTSSSSSNSSGSSDGSNGSSSVWRRVLRPSVMLAVSSPVILLVNIGLIVVFLLRQNWQGVILSSIAFIAWTQVIYWYFRARTLLQPRYQVRSGGSDPEAAADAPPSYEEVIKTEAPPPPYYMVVSEGGWSSGTYGSNSHAAKEGLPSEKSKSSRLYGQQETPATVCGGITAPYLHHITSDEHSHIPTTSSALTDHAQVIRAPIDREICRLAVPIHKTAPTRPTSMDRLQDAAHEALVS